MADSDSVGLGLGSVWTARIWYGLWGRVEMIAGAGLGLKRVRVWRVGKMEEEEEAREFMAEKDSVECI